MAAPTFRGGECRRAENRHCPQRDSYHAPPILEAEGTSFRESPGQWIELFNRGSNRVSPAGWWLDEAVSFRSDRIVLRDARDNPADVVRYFDGGVGPKRPTAADPPSSSAIRMRTTPRPKRGPRATKASARVGKPAHTGAWPGRAPWNRTVNGMSSSWDYSGRARCCWTTCRSSSRQTSSTSQCCRTARSPRAPRADRTRAASRIPDRPSPVSVTIRLSRRPRHRAVTWRSSPAGRRTAAAVEPVEAASPRFYRVLGLR